VLLGKEDIKLLLLNWHISWWLLNHLATELGNKFFLSFAMLGVA
jgi:hypothetical protein